MLAAENASIPGAKVGGIGDVVRDIPKALVEQSDDLRDVQISVLIPAYGTLHELDGASRIGVCTTSFRAKAERIELYELYAGHRPGVRHLLLHHPLFGAAGPGQVYCNDDADQPFATDASKFALFSRAAISAINEQLLGQVDVLHLHDWHTALAPALIRFDSDFTDLQSLPCVFSIHNLALQGIRPLAGDPSSLESWFPHLNYDPGLLCDPRWPHCINPMAAGIRLADKVHTVSENYAREILDANDDIRGFHGGEGLEADLNSAADQGRLKGIINGIYYYNKLEVKLDWRAFLEKIAADLLSVIAQTPELTALDYLAHQRLLQWQQKKRPPHLLTSVGRLTDQKVKLLLHPIDSGKSAIEQILDSLSRRGLFILLGSGDARLERQCSALAAVHPHFIFINQYSDTLSQQLFAQGDLFVMPSSFEPCGISQMLAMQHGQPCLAHAVGGLVDTIEDGVDGFLFSADTVDNQARALVSRCNDVLALRENNPRNFAAVCDRASKKRFEWNSSATRYLQELYT